MKVTERNERKRNDKLRGKKRKKKNWWNSYLKNDYLKGTKREQKWLSLSSSKKGEEREKTYETKTKILSKKKEKNRK